MKKSIYKIGFLLFLILSISSCASLFGPSNKKIEAYIENKNAQIDSTSMALKQQMDLPQEISKNIAVMGNPNAKTVLINAQGGPMTSIQNFELMYILMQAKVNKDSLLAVNVHQYQTLRTKEFETKLITFEDAKKYDAETTKMLAQTVDYFKRRGNTVIVTGISFGAFVVEDLLATYPAIADRYIIVAGRLDMPDAVWKEFAKGNYVGFKYKKGEPHIVKFTPKQAGMGGGNSIGDKNTSVLAAGLGYKRFTRLLQDKDLSRVDYFYGSIDDQVGRLSDEEISFLKSKGVNPIKFDKNHEGAIDDFTVGYLKDIVHKVSKETNIDPSMLGSIVNKNFTKTFPFEWSGGLPIVKVTIDGKEYKFLFDTDAPTSIPEYLAVYLHLKKITKIKLHDSGGRQLERSLYQLPLLTVAGVKFQDFVVSTANFKDIFPISCLGFDGILGYNFIRDLKVKIDYNKQEITFSDMPIPHGGYTPLNIHFEPKQGPLVELNFPFGSGHFIFDTGKNTDIQLGNPAVIPDFDNQGYEYRETFGTFSASIANNNTDRLKRTYLVKDFSLDSVLHIKSFPVSIDNSNAYLIGDGFLKHFTVIFDLPNQKAYFQKINKEDLNEGFEDTFGFTPFWNETDGLFISAITDKTPAAEAELKVGDKILSLNGKDVSKMEKEDFCVLLQQASSSNSMDKQKELKITIRRGNGAPQSFLLNK